MNRDQMQAHLTLHGWEPVRWGRYVGVKRVRDTFPGWGLDVVAMNLQIMEVGTWRKSLDTDHYKGMGWEGLSTYVFWRVVEGITELEKTK